VISGESDAFLVEPEWTNEHLDDHAVRIVEVDVSPANYTQGHIPGAMLWNAYADLRDAAYRPISRTEFEQVLSRSGISEETTVVFYGYGAFLGLWLMKAHGHPDARVLDRGRDGWAQHGGPWSIEVPVPRPTTYRLPMEDATMLASRNDIDAAIDDGSTVILDVRSVDEFRGDRFWPSGASADVGHAGRIPNARHVPIDLVRNENGAMKGADELRRLYADAGVLPDLRVIVYCTIGNRASLTWFILNHLLGYPNVAVYQGSYVEWGKLPNARVAVG
jgi:thiosulfate/3-mercaptopyruvate sulfurtransferase